MTEKWRRVVLEGPINDEGDPEWFYIGRCNDTNLIRPTAVHVKSVEDIDPPEQWQDGDVVWSGDFALVLDGSYWYVLDPERGPCTGYPHDHFNRGVLTLLVRDGKPVAL